MRPNPGLDIEAAITELGVGEALVSLLDVKGRPGITERVWMMAPGSRIGPATDAERQAVRNGSILGGKYDKTIDRESAYEVLLQRTEQRQAPAQSDSDRKSVVQGTNVSVRVDRGGRGPN